MGKIAILLSYDNGELKSGITMTEVTINDVSNVYIALDNLKEKVNNEYKKLIKSSEVTSNGKV